jgi:WhiB family redox-sensing transcriptional regulator
MRGVSTSAPVVAPVRRLVCQVSTEVVGAVSGWWHDAACRDEMIEAFFPSSQGGNYAHARRVCARCPVIDECRAEAERVQPAAGMWAGKVYGTDDRQRERDRARKRKQRAEGVATYPLGAVDNHVRESQGTRFTMGDASVGRTVA